MRQATKENRSKCQPVRIIAVGGIQIGAVSHTGSRKFMASFYLASPGEKPLGPFKSSTEAEKQLVRHWLEDKKKQAFMDGYKQCATDQAARRDDLRRQEQEIAERSEKAAAGDLSGFTLEELAHEFVAMWAKKNTRASWDEKDNACATIWETTCDTMRSQITEAQLTEYCRDAGLKLWDDPAAREEIREEIMCENLDHPAMAELRWAARAQSDSEFNSCIQKAIWHIKWSD